MVGVAVCAALGSQHTLLLLGCGTVLVVVGRCMCGRRDHVLAHLLLRRWRVFRGGCIQPLGSLGPPGRRRGTCCPVNVARPGVPGRACAAHAAPAVPLCMQTSASSQGMAVSACSPPIVTWSGYMRTKHTEAGWARRCVRCARTHVSKRCLPYVRGCCRPASGSYAIPGTML
jgi:hypothetical protein